MVFVAEPFRQPITSIGFLAKRIYVFIVYTEFRKSGLVLLQPRL